jgi:Zn-dependent protease with chaperone function
LTRSTAIIALWLPLLAPAVAREALRHPTDGVTAAHVERAQDAQNHKRVAVPEPTPEAIQYYQSGMILWAVRGIIAIAIPLTLLFTGWSARLRDYATTVAGRWHLSTKTLQARGARLEAEHAVYGGLYFTISTLTFLPIEFYSTYVRSHAYGLSNQTVKQWFLDALMSYGLLLAVCMVAVPVVFFLLALSRRRWWLYATGAAAAFLLLVQTVLPVWIIPLYDRLGPMHDRALESDIMALASRAGIEGGRVYEVAKSEDTNRVNAYVTGTLGTKRIVLWDTLLQKLNREQVLFVMGHEMAHFVLGHTWETLLVSTALVLISFYIVHRTINLVLQQLGERWSIHAITDVASLPAMIVIVGVVAFLVTPIQMAYNRHLEHEADRFGLEITKDNYAAASTWLVLQQANLNHPRPGPIFRIWRATHPVLSDRITFANDYRPWATGEPLRYARYFHDAAPTTDSNSPSR